MTQFAYFTGPKPEYENCEFVRLSEDVIRKCWGADVSEEEAQNSWVVASEYDDVFIDTLCAKASTIESIDEFVASDLYKLIESCIDSCESITFAYCGEASAAKSYKSKINFLASILDQVLNNGGMVYARYDRGS